MDEKQNQQAAGITCQAVVDGYTDFIFLNRYGNAHNPQTINRAIKRITFAANEEETELAEKTSDLLAGIYDAANELEEKLDTSRFLRISNSEIVNLRKIQRMDTSLTGTVKMYLDENIETYVSRRYVTRIKRALGI